MFTCEEMAGTCAVRNGARCRRSARQTEIASAGRDWLRIRRDADGAACGDSPGRERGVARTGRGRVFDDRRRRDHAGASRPFTTAFWPGTSISMDAFIAREENVPSIGQRRRAAGWAELARASGRDFLTAMKISYHVPGYGIAQARDACGIRPYAASCDFDRLRRVVSAGS